MKRSKLISLFCIHNITFNGQKAIGNFKIFNFIVCILAVAIIIGITFGSDM